VTQDDLTTISKFSAMQKTLYWFKSPYVKSGYGRNKITVCTGSDDFGPRPKALHYITSLRQLQIVSQTYKSFPFLQSLKSSFAFTNGTYILSRVMWFPI